MDIQENIRDGLREISVAITVPDHAEVFIERNSQALDALEHVVRLMHGRDATDRVAISVDVNRHRHMRLERAITLAQQTAERVRATGQAETLMAMSSQERRAVHTTLAAYPGITTESVGQEPTRRIVIKAAPIAE